MTESNGILSRENAETAHYFHPAGQSGCAQVVTIGPRGGIHYPTTELWRRNGATQTWKTRPAEFRVPVKFGLYDYAQLRNDDYSVINGYWHVGEAATCPLGPLSASIERVQTALLDGTL